MTHDELVQYAIRWLKMQNHRVIISEKKGLNVESPDAIGFKYGDQSTLVECKTGRSDFLADKNKPFRIRPEKGMGLIRYYISPPEVITVEDLPEKWGLLHVDGGKIITVKRVIPREEYFHERNVKAELRLLTSFAAGLMIPCSCYD